MEQADRITRVPIIPRVPIIRRVPIIPRVPIIQRTPITLSNQGGGEGTIAAVNSGDSPVELEWDDVWKEFSNLIKYAAGQVSFQNPGLTLSSSEDLYQEGCIILWNCYERYKTKPLVEFGAIFKSSMWRKMRSLANEPSQTVSLDDDNDPVDLPNTAVTDDHVDDDLYNQGRIENIIAMLDGHPVAIRILREFISPSEDSIKECEYDIYRKSMIKSLGHSVKVPTTVEVKGIHIQRALHITKDVYHQNMKLIQSCVYEVYSKDVDIHSYVPDPSVDFQLRNVPDGTMSDDDVKNLVEGLCEALGEESDAAEIV